MSSNPFSAPASASGIQWSELLGRLLVIEPKAVEQGIQTAYGDAEAVRADIHVLDGETTSYDDVLIFPAVLRSQTRSKVGEMVLGRLGQGQAKPSQSPPWMIEAPSEADLATATTWLEQSKKGQFTGPSKPTTGAKPPF